MSNAFETDGFPFATVVAIFLLSMSLAMVLGNYIDPLYIWGGMECGPPNQNGIQGCFGYVPILLPFIILIAAVVVLQTRETVLRWVGENND